MNEEEKNLVAKIIEHKVAEAKYQEADARFEHSIEILGECEQTSELEVTADALYAASFRKLTEAAKAIVKASEGRAPFYAARELVAKHPNEAIAVLKNN